MESPNNLRDVKVASPEDLPPEWREKYLTLAQRYRRTRLWANPREADEAAFKDTRKEWWRGMNRHGDPVSPSSPAPSPAHE